MPDQPDESSDGRTVVCGACDAKLRVSLIPARGYRIVCNCPKLAVSIDDSVSKSSLFDPLTGKWSSVNDSE